MADSKDSPDRVEEVLDGGQIPVALPSSSTDEPSIRSTYDVNVSNIEKYEAMFATRFTNDSESYASIAENGFARTVAIYPWTSRPKRNFDYGGRRNGSGGGNYRGRGSYRRDWVRDDRDRGSRDQSRSDRSDNYQRDRGDYRGNRDQPRSDRSDNYQRDRGDYRGSRDQPRSDRSDHYQQDRGDYHGRRDRDERVQYPGRR